MAFVLRELRLPAEEDAFATAWVSTPEFQAFFEWVSSMLQKHADEGCVVPVARALGKVLSHAGKSILEIADEGEADGQEGWDGTEPTQTP